MDFIAWLIFILVIWFICRGITKIFKSTNDDSGWRTTTKKDTDILNIIFSPDKEKESSSVDLFIDLTEQNFNHLREAAYKLADFGVEVCAQSKVSAKLNTVMNLTNDEGPVSLKDKIRYTIFADAYRCFIYLDGKYNSKKFSSLALALFGNRVLISDSHVDFEDINIFLANNFELCNNYYVHIYELTQKQGVFPNSVFYLEYILEDCGMFEERATYLSFLYQFTSAIVVAFDLQNDKAYHWISTQLNHMKGGCFPE